MTMTHLKINENIRLAMALVARAERLFRPGVDSYAFLELPKLALADAVLEAVRAQQQHTAPLAQVPRATPAAVRPEKRRRRA